jgi:hypothetical protein
MLLAWKAGSVALCTTLQGLDSFFTLLVESGALRSTDQAQGGVFGTESLSDYHIYFPMTNNVNRELLSRVQALNAA